MLNILCVTSFVTSSVAVFEGVIRVQSMYDKIVIENQKNRENMKRKKIDINLRLSIGLGMLFTAC